MNTFRTNEVAKMIGIHVNTVWLYEECGLIPKPERQENGYRIFTDLHIEQFRLARKVLQTEILQNGLRKLAVCIVKTSAAGDYDKAEDLIGQYVERVNAEEEKANEAIKIARKILSGIEGNCEIEDKTYSRKEAADFLEVSIDTLRNWELNGLFTIKRRQNGYRVYTEADLQGLMIIRSMRCANYSLAAILRMLRALSSDPKANILEIIDTPELDDDIITACDRLLTSLKEAKDNALFAAQQIKKLKRMTSNKPTLTHQSDGTC